MMKVINQILVRLINDYFNRINEAEKKRFLNCEVRVAIKTEKFEKKGFYFLHFFFS